VKETDYAGAQKEIADASTPLVVDLHAEWCTFCKKTRPHLERLSDERGDALRIVGIDTDEDPDAFSGLGVKTLPTIILFKDGQEIARRGSGDYEQLTEWLAEHGL
jgi:thioredoxin-like negative regulator of GroEL